jgi:peptide/nickel transport system substrate-binding protein
MSIDPTHLDESQDHEEETLDQGFLARQRTRREFLRLAGAGAVALGLGGAGFLAGCGNAATTTTSGAQTTVTTGPTTTGAGPATTAAGPTTTAAAAGPVKGGQLLIGCIGNSADTADPNNIASTMTANTLIFSMYDQLLAPPPVESSLAFQLALAEEVTMENPSSWIARLRQGVTFHNGKPVTADDVIFSFKRALTKGSFTSGILNAVDPNAIDKVDDRTVRFRLKSPDSMMNEGLWQVFIVPTDFDPAKPVGTGPFKMDTFAPGSKATLSRYDGFWDQGKPYADGMVVYSFTDDTARINALVGGQVDVLTNIDLSQVAVVQANKSLQVVAYHTPTVYSINMNVQKEPFTDPQVRQACRFAANRQQLVDQVFAGHAQVANDLMPGPADPNYASDLPQRAYDPDQAKSLMQKSGKGSTAIALNTANTAPSIVDLATAYAQQAQAVGIKMTVNKLDPSVYFGPDYSNRQTSTSFWPAQTLSVQYALSFLPDSPYNSTHFNDTEFNSLFTQARAEADPAKRKDLFHQMQVIIYDRGSVVVPVNADQVDAYSQKIGGAQPVPIVTYADTRNLWVKS